MRFRDHDGMWGERWIAQSTCQRYVITLNNEHPRLTQYEARWIDDERKRTWRIGHPQKARRDAEVVCEMNALTPNFKEA
jgi:hypothetical protein